MISAVALGKSFGAHDIFRNLSFTVAKGARLAVVGPNGIGKTTLLRILVGLEDPSSGLVTRAKKLHVGYLPQEADFQLEGELWDFCLLPFADLIRTQVDLQRLEHAMAEPATRQQALLRYGPLQHDFEQRGGYQYENRIREVLSGLGFSAGEYRASLDHLSGGQRTRAHLARLLLTGPELLVLDEPTNHLDMAAVEWLEAYLSRWDGSAVIVSHDRYFLDRSCNGLLEMTASACEYYRGSYTTYLQERENRWNHHAELIARERTRLMKEVEYIKKHIAGQNTLQAKGKLKRLTRVVQAIEQVGMEAYANSSWSRLGIETTTSPFSVEEAERRVRSLQPPRRTSQPIRLHFRQAERSGDLVLRTAGLEIGYADRPLFGAPDIELRRRECAALIGPNGTGKTTFLRTILGQLKPRAGEVLLGASLSIAYFAQAHEGLDARRTAAEEISAAAPSMRPHEVQDYLARYGFSGDAPFKKVEVLSGGERGRLALAKLALQDANLLLLDEPTNHLDIPAQEVLQSVLEDYHGTILLITHDRFLVEALASQIWEIDPQEARLTVFLGRYSQMRQQREQVILKIPAGSERASTRPIRRSRSPAGGKEARRRIARVQEIENSISRLDTELSKLAAQLESPPPGRAETARLGLQYERIQAQMDAMLRDWEALHGQAVAPDPD